MPLPIIAAALAWLIEAGLALLAHYIRVLILTAAAEYVWPLIKRKIVEWARDMMPRLVIEVIRQVVGLDVRWPMSPQSLTQAVNDRIGEWIFNDITDEEAVRDDVCKWACREVSKCLPGAALKPEDFNKSATARRRLARKLRVSLELHVTAALEAGESPLLPAQAVQTVMQLAQSGYHYEPHVNLMHLKNIAGRQKAAWWRRHATRIRERVGRA